MMISLAKELQDLDEVVLNCVSFQYLPFFHNCYESMKRVGMTQNLLVACLDSDTYDEVSKLPVRAIRADFIPSQTLGDRYLSKVRIVHRLLMLGKTVLLVDVDIVMCHDPLPYLREMSEKYDMVAQNTLTGHFNTGFYYIKPNAGTIALFDMEVGKDEIREWNHKPLWDQRVLNERLMRSEVKLYRLPLDLFPVKRFFFRAKPTDHYMVHFTGGSKLQNMRKMGLWYTTDEWFHLARKHFRWNVVGDPKQPGDNRPRKKSGQQRTVFLPFARRVTERPKDNIDLLSLYDEDVDKRVLEAQNKVFSKFGYELTQMPLDYEKLEKMLSEPTADYYMLLAPDTIPLVPNAVEMIYHNICRGNSIAGIAQCCEYKQFRQPFAGDGMVAFSHSIYEKLGRPTLRPTNMLDKFQMLSKKAVDRDGVNVHLLMPTQVQHPRWTLHTTGHRYGIGTTYGGILYHTFEIWKPRYVEIFLKKCEEVL
jgi:hypothetical protein